MTWLTGDRLLGNIFWWYLTDTHWLHTYLSFLITDRLAGLLQDQLLLVKKVTSNSVINSPSIHTITSVLVMTMLCFSIYLFGATLNVNWVLTLCLNVFTMDVVFLAVQHGAANKSLHVSPVCLTSAVTICCSRKVCILSVRLLCNLLCFLYAAVPHNTQSTGPSAVSTVICNLSYSELWSPTASWLPHTHLIKNQTLTVNSVWTLYTECLFFQN